MVFYYWLNKGLYISVVVKTIDLNSSISKIQVYPLRHDLSFIAYSGRNMARTNFLIR